MIAEAMGKGAAPSHIRPFDLHRDLAALASLIEVAFGPELAVTGSEIVQDMRQMALWGSMLWLAGATTAPLAGFVWVENGEVVGNASLNRESEGSGVWTLSNVAVLPGYRGRGIAGQLLDTAVGYVRNHGGKRILLQVRAENQPALTLYRRRGFFTFDTLHELSLPRNNWPPSPCPSSASLRRVRAADGCRIYHLVLNSRPREVWKQRPVKAQQFHRGLWWQVLQHLQMALAGRERFELLGESAGEAVAYGNLTVHLFRGPHELELYVLPGQRGRWESELVHGLLGLVEDLPRQSVRTSISASHPEAIQVLQGLGYQTLRVLEQMALELG